jgi:hypothetical protein
MSFTRVVEELVDTPAKKSLKGLSSVPSIINRHREFIGRQQTSSFTSVWTT